MRAAGTDYDVRLVYVDETKLTHASGGSQSVCLRARLKQVAKYAVEFDHGTKLACVSACARLLRVLGLCIFVLAFTLF